MLNRSSRKTFLFILAVPIFSILLLAAFYVYIAVQNNAQNAQTAAWIAVCNDSKQGQEFQCWVDGIESIIQQKGAYTAFSIISTRLLNEPSFKRSCHDILHEVGHWAYHYTMHNKKFVMPPKVTLCASGFDRGFVEELTSATGDFAKAMAFCTDPKLASESPEATASCYHGIGHGALSFYGPRMVGGGQTLIVQALEECAKIASTSSQLDSCAGGVFSEVVKFYQTNQYGVSLNKKDPFSFCREQEEGSYKKACYATAKPFLLWLTNEDFSKAASFVEDIVEDEYAIFAMDALATSVTSRNIKENISVVDYDADIFACRELQERLRPPCIAGLAIELLTHSSPTDALTFCRLSILSEQERGACFRRVVPNLPEWTPRDKIQQICSSLEEQYKEFCR